MKEPSKLMITVEIKTRSAARKKNKSEYRVTINLVNKVPVIQQTAYNK